jgi:HTH-type transcriptional regulator/antitoxin HigA
MIAARITKRLSQKDLARKLGLREQQIQRYEADRYKSITLANYQKVADILGAQLSVNIEAHKKERTLSYGAPSGEDLAKVLQHARANGWVDVNEPEESAASQLVRYVVDHVLRHGTPSLLRTGLDVVDHAGDWTLLSWKAQVTLSWKAQVTRAAERIIAERKPVYRPIDVSWLTELVRLSRLDDGPARARDALLGHGVVLVIEPHITGMGMDGAAFLVEGVPVIGMTLLRDAVDNFWFTLLHEIAHVVLHYRTGLSAGFFDDVTSTEVDELEGEANAFAGNLLIPKRSGRGRQRESRRRPSRSRGWRSGSVSTRP